MKPTSLSKAESWRLNSDWLNADWKHTLPPPLRVLPTHRVLTRKICRKRVTHHTFIPELAKIRRSWCARCWHTRRGLLSSRWKQQALLWCPPPRSLPSPPCQPGAHGTHRRGEIWSSLGPSPSTCRGEKETWVGDLCCMLKGCSVRPLVMSWWRFTKKKKKKK